MLLTHRRTPSAGSLGCGHVHTPSTPSPVYRFSTSEPVSPICIAPPPSGLSKDKDTYEVPSLALTLIADEEGCNGKSSDKSISGKEGPSAQSSTPPRIQEKHRSLSADNRMISNSFQPIRRCLSNPTPTKPRAESVPSTFESKQDTSSGRFSPYETFTENELTESKEFSEIALRANEGSALNETHGSRNTSLQLESSLRKEQESEMDKLLEERIKYENGEKGRLHPSFHSPAQKLLQFAKEIDTPSVQVQKGTLLTRYSVDAILFELMNLVKALCPDMKSKIYRAVPNNPSSIDSLLMMPTEQYVLYDPIRPPLQTKDQKESSVDKTGSCMATSARPTSTFVFISRNIEQWRGNLQKMKDSCNEETEASKTLNKDFYASQQFQSWNCDGNDDGSERTKGMTVPFSNCSPGFVSRQRLILIDIKDKEIIAITYNLSNDINGQLAARLTRLIQWNNARCHLVSCLLQQKMGLFHHSPFQGLNIGTKEINPFCETVNDHHLFSLLKQTAPSSSDKSASREKQIPTVGKMLFEETLRDVVPTEPLQDTKHCSYRDPVKRHGAQFQEIRAKQIRSAVQNAELQKLFESWLAGPYNALTGENSINLLKRRSRLIPCPKTPFLVCDEWMTSIEEKANTKGGPLDTVPSKDVDQDKNELRPESAVKENEWHYKLREEFINYYTQYLQSQRFALVQCAAPPPIKSSKGQRKPSKQARKKGVVDRPKPMNGNGADSGLKLLHYYLQKTSDGRKDSETYAYDGGIMLIEIGFEGCHFFVKLYAYESRRLLSSKISQQTKNTFLAECHKVKELLHLNSFSYDFHLRHVQYFLFGQRLVFPKGFRLTSVLTRLMKVYIYPPKFSWNLVCRGQLSLMLCRLPRATVFSYIVEHARRYNFSTVEMDDKQGECEHVLVSLSSQNKSYDVSLLAKLDENAEEGILSLKFFVVMTHRRELFPKIKAEFPRRKQSSGFTGDAGLRQRHAVSTLFPSNSSELEQGYSYAPSTVQDKITRSSSSPQFITPVPLSHSPSEELLRHLSPTFSPKSSDSTTSPAASCSSQISAAGVERTYVIKGLESDPTDSLLSWDMRTLANEADRCYSKLLSTVSLAQEHCMRDHLWHLLLRGTSSDENSAEGNAWKSKGLRKKTEKGRSPSGLTETWTVPVSLKDVADGKITISCEDFEYLLNIVQPISLPAVDEKLKPFLSMDVGWYLGLWTSLMSRFGDRSREFSKCDGKLRYFVLLNPKNLDMFMFIVVHEERRLTEVKIANRTASEENKKSARIVPKSCDDFIQEVVNAFCYQMWTGLLLG